LNASYAIFIGLMMHSAFRTGDNLQYRQMATIKDSLHFPRRAPMNTIFRSWKRKAGCVTLGLAVALTGSWMRSQFAPDILCWSIGRRTEVIISSDGNLSWWRLATEEPVKSFWNPGFVKQSTDGSHYAMIGKWFVELDAANSCPVPYWTFALPMALLSAYLLFSKPPAPKSTESP
jgi:hypothetical protein